MGTTDHYPRKVSGPWLIDDVFTITGRGKVVTIHDTDKVVEANVMVGDYVRLDTLHKSILDDEWFEPHALYQVTNIEMTKTLMSPPTIKGIGLVVRKIANATIPEPEDKGVVVPSARGVNDAVAELARYNIHHEIPMDIGMLKLTEEAGEVAKAWIGVTGTNPRKGKYGTVDDVIKELSDVIVTAMVAQRRLGADPMAELTAKLAFVINRIAEGEAS